MQQWVHVRLVANLRQIYNNLFIGPKTAYENDVAFRKGWRVIHATKEPYHRQTVGYVNTDPPSDHPEYLVAKRKHRLMLNLIDASVEVEIPRRIFDDAISFIHEGLMSGSSVLVHCEQGISRSASIGLLYLRRYTNVMPTATYAEAEKRYRIIYPLFSPGKAIRYFLTTHWEEYDSIR